MGKLNARNRALSLDESRYSRKRLDMLIGPEPHILRRDAPLGHNRRRLHDDKPRAPRRPAAEMHKMPVVGEAVLGRILAHGRDGDAIAESHAPQFQRSQEIDLGHPQILPGFGPPGTDGVLRLRLTLGHGSVPFFSTARSR